MYPDTYNTMESSVVKSEWLQGRNADATRCPLNPQAQSMLLTASKPAIVVVDETPLHPSKPSTPSPSSSLSASSTSSVLDSAASTTTVASSAPTNNKNQAYSNGSGEDNKENNIRAAGGLKDSVPTGEAKPPTVMFRNNVAKSNTETPQKTMSVINPSNLSASTADNRKTKGEN